MRLGLQLSVCLIVATTITSGGSAVARASQSAKPIFSDDNNCESNKAYWDYIAIESKGDSLILIARPGDGENARRLNRRRLHNIYTYLTYIRKIPKERIVIAEGERVTGRGRVEVYLQGKLQIVFTVGRNADLRGGACEEALSTLYYPMKRRRPH